MLAIGAFTLDHEAKEDYFFRRKSDSPETVL